MKFPENPTLEGTRIGKVIDSLRQEFETRFESTITDKIQGGMSCDDDNVNMLVCRFKIITDSSKFYVNEKYMDIQHKLFEYSKISNEDYKIEDLRVEQSDNSLKVVFYAKCTF